MRKADRLSRPWSLTRRLAFGVALAGPAAAAEPVDFGREVWPILERRCVGCHGPEKQKAKLRLDSPAAIREGANGEPILRPGHARTSALHQRVTLPADHVDVMPPDGHGPALTPAEQALLGRWIDAGADFGIWKGTVAGAGGSTSAIDAAALARLRAAGAMTAPLHRGSDLLLVDFGPAALRTTDEHLALLPPLAAHVAWLDLSGAEITDAGLERLRGLPRLERLHLDGTRVGDAGLRLLRDLPSLAFLNLHGTRATDRGLAALAALPALREVVVAGTSVTEAGRRALARAHPRLLLTFDRRLPPPPPASPKAARPAAEDE